MAISGFVSIGISYVAWALLPEYDLHMHMHMHMLMHMHMHMRYKCTDARASRCA